MSTVYLLTGDIGGTNSRMSLYSTAAAVDGSASDITKSKLLATKTFRNALHLPEKVLGDERAFLDNIVQPFLKYCWEEQTENKLAAISDKVLIVGCIASAGVVSDNRVRLTNLANMSISGNLIEKDTSTPYLSRVVRCMIINDFVAQGYGCLTLKEHEVKHLYGPKVQDLCDVHKQQGPKVCVGAGTGLGECYLTQSFHVASHDPYSCFPSEGGHVEFAPRDSLEVELFEHLSKKFTSKNRVSVERVVSGKGLANVYEFLASKFPDKLVPAVHQEFLAAGDEQGRVVATNSSNEGSLCNQAMSIMMSAYGCEVGSAAIKWIPTGGLFVTGGLTPKNIAWIEGVTSQFMLSYLNKGRVSPVLERIPLYAVLTEDLGVRGAHQAALMAYENYCAVCKEEAKDDKAGGQVGSAMPTSQADMAGVGLAAALASVVGVALGLLIGQSRRH